MSTCIYYVDALCGAGKTYAAENWAYKEAKNGGKICIVQPTIDLINQCYSNLVKINSDKKVFIEKITTDQKDNGVGVLSNLATYLKDVAQPGTILLITQISFLKINYFHNSNEWKVIFDEIPNPLTYIEIPITTSTKDYLQDLDIVDINPEIKHLKFKDKTKHKLKNSKKGWNEDIILSGVLKDLAEYLNNAKYNVLVRNSDLAHYLTLGNTRSFTAIAELNFDFIASFQQIIFMGALFKDSFLYKIMIHKNKNLGLKYNFIEFDDIKTLIRKDNGFCLNSHNEIIHHNKNAKLNIYFGYERPWSKNFYEKTDQGNNEKYISLYVKAISNKFENRKYIYTINNTETGYENYLRGGTKVKNWTYGLNEYQDYCNSAYISANNPPPSYFNIAKMLGLNSDDIRTQIYHHTAYQFLLRTSLRSISSTKDNTIIVPDIELANFIASKFSNSTVMKLDGLPVVGKPKLGRNKITNCKSQCERSKDWYRNKLIKEVYNLHDTKFSENNTNNNMLENFDNKISNENSLIYKGVSVRKKLDLQSIVKYQYYKNKYSLNEPDYTAPISVKDTLDFMVGMHKSKDFINSRKEETPLLSPCFYKSDKRTKTDIDHAFGIWIDIDGGDLTPKTFLKLFPDTFIVYFNTYTSEKNRYRVFIPTDMYLNNWAYKDLVESIICRVEESGYHIPIKSCLKGCKICKCSKSKKCKLDTSKKNANSLFYLPRQSAFSRSKKYNFFKIREGKFLDVEFYLNHPLHYENEVNEDQVVDDSIENNINMYKLPVDRSDFKNLNLKTEIDRKIEEYKSVTPNVGLRNAAFFQLGLHLKLLGLSYTEIENILRDSDYDGSRKRKNSIKYVIQSLKKTVSNKKMRELV